jgi:hypothetical protein
MALGLRKKSQIISFPHLFFALLTDIHLIFGTLIYNTKIQIKFEFGFDPLIFHEVMALGLRKKITNYQFSALFSLCLPCLQIFIWYLVHRFAIPRYRLSLSLALIHWFFTKLWPSDLEKYHKLSVFRTFLSLLTDIHLIFAILFCHTKLQIKFKFGFLSIWNSRSYGPWTYYIYVVWY